MVTGTKHGAANFRNGKRGPVLLLKRGRTSNFAHLWSWRRRVFPITGGDGKVWPGDRSAELPISMCCLLWISKRSVKTSYSSSLKESILNHCGWKKRAAPRELHLESTGRSRCYQRFGL